MKGGAATEVLEEVVTPELVELVVLLEMCPPKRTPAAAAKTITIATTTTKTVVCFVVTLAPFAEVKLCAAASSSATPSVALLGAPLEESQGAPLAPFK